MADKKLSAYGLLSSMSTEDLFVVLQSIGNGEFANKNIKFADLLEATVANIKASGTASLGTGFKLTRSDHVHPFMKTIADNVVLDTILEPGNYTGRILANFAANAPQGTFNATIAFTLRVVQTYNNFRFQFYMNEVASTLPTKYQQPSLFVRRYDGSVWGAWEDFAGDKLFMKAMTSGLAITGGTLVLNLSNGAQDVSTVLAAGSYRYTITGAGGGGGGGTSTNRRGGVGGAGGSISGTFWLPFECPIAALSGAGGGGGSNSGASSGAGGGGGASILKINNIRLYIAAGGGGGGGSCATGAGGGGGGGAFGSGGGGGAGGTSSGAGGACGAISGGGGATGNGSGGVGNAAISYGWLSGGAGGTSSNGGVGGSGAIYFSGISIGGNGSNGRTSDGQADAAQDAGNSENLARGGGGVGGSSGQGSTGGTGGAGTIQIWKTA